jgi:monovalent cation:H+ antiporter-2, CPA2 family
MEAQHSLPYLRETLMFLVLTGILIPLLQRWRVNQVLGFLAAGALVGPFGLGLWADVLPWLAYFTFPRREGIESLAELGVLFLMFMVGLELSAARLWALRRWVFGAGTAQVGISAIAIGTVAYLFGNPIETTIVLGLVLALSSTAVVIQMLTERRTLGTPLGQASFSILMLQDLAVVPLLILVGVLANANGDGAGVTWMAAISALKSLAAIVLIYVLGRRVLSPLFRYFSAKRQPEVFMALTLLSTLGIGALTQAVGLSMALGAFLAGLLLAETEFKHEVEVTVEPFKGLLMGLFFMSVGMGVDVRTIAQSPVWLPLSVVGLFGIKIAVLVLIFRVGGFNWGRALEGGALLGQGGEFTFIVVGYALTTGLMAPDVGNFMMLVVGLSLFATPLVAKAGSIFGDWWDARHGPRVADLEQAGPAELGGHVVVAGFGRVGQLIAQLLEQQKIRYVAVDSDIRLVGRLHARGMPVYTGDAARVDLLNKVHAAQAAAIVVTMDHPVSTLHAVKAIRRAYPSIPLFARARDEKHALVLKRAGVSLVVPETLETGLQLASFVLQAVGVEEGAASHTVQLERERCIGELDEAPATPHQAGSAGSGAVASAHLGGTDDARPG